MVRILSLSGLVLLAACGKAPEPPAVEPRGVWRGTVVLPPSLSASRLLSAGCIQIVERADKSFAAEFFSQSCPEDSQTLLPVEARAFSLAAEPRESQWTLRKDGVRVGILRAAPPSPFVLEHLCQISDPKRRSDGYYAEICEVRFTPGDGEKAGLFSGLELASLETLAESKALDRANAVSDTRRDERRLGVLAQEMDRARGELHRAQQKEQEARDAMAEAQRGVRDSLATNVSVQRSLQRTKIAAELDHAMEAARYYELAIRFANAEKERGQLIQRQISESDRAKSRAETLQKQVEHYQKHGLLESNEGKIVLSLRDQNATLVMTPEAQRKAEEAATFALATADEFEKLTEKARQAYGLLIDKKDELNKFDQLTAPPIGD